jgi:diadenosine tetraphosphate (Ap4A) HIT family hydrolase
MMSYTETNDFGAIPMTDCTLCAELESNTDRAPWNNALIETEHFAVIPSLGALVEGWLLIAPKKHYISMGALPLGLRAEADELESHIRSLLTAKYQLPVVAFEHGPSAPQHGTGCSVDHAHLHLVPLECDLRAYTQPFIAPSSQWRTCDWDERTEAYRSGLDYLYLRPEGVDGLIAVSEDFGSQIFRKAISSYLGVEQEFNWRAYPRHEVVARTIEGIANAWRARSFLYQLL